MDPVRPPEIPEDPQSPETDPRGAVLAILGSATVVLMIGYDTRMIPAAVVPGIAAILCAYAAASAEGIERSMHRRWRWIRIRYHYRRSVAARYPRIFATLREMAERTSRVQ